MMILKASKKSDSLHASMRFPIQLAQCFSFFPIKGISGPNYRSLQFKWRSWRMLYSLITFIGIVFCLGAELHKILFITSNLFELNGLIFELCGAIQCMLNWKLSLEWRQFVREWTETENSLRNYDFTEKLQRRLKIMTIIIMAPAAVEHILVSSYKLKSSFDEYPSTYEAFKHFFVVTSYSHVFIIVSYSPWTAMVLQFLNLQKTFSWNFLDVFIILISTAFAVRLKQIAKRIRTLSKFKVKDISVWRKIREDYDRLYKLCNTINEKISYLVILSFTANLYFILVQLFSSLRPIRNSLERAYFYISFGLLILRIVCICIFSGRVFEESKAIVPVLNSVPEEIYNLEIERFLNHIHVSEMVITGRNFFSITRGLILKIAGAIVTYELVLIQFKGNFLKS